MAVLQTILQKKELGCENYVWGCEIYKSCCKNYKLDCDNCTLGNQLYKCTCSKLKKPLKIYDLSSEV